jgi:hypothetical protein
VVSAGCAGRHGAHQHVACSCGSPRAGSPAGTLHTTACHCCGDLRFSMSFSYLLAPPCLHPTKSRTFQHALLRPVL